MPVLPAADRQPRRRRRARARAVPVDGGRRGAGAAARSRSGARGRGHRRRRRRGLLLPQARDAQGRHLQGRPARGHRGHQGRHRVQGGQGPAHAAHLPVRPRHARRLRPHGQGAQHDAQGDPRARQRGGRGRVQRLGVERRHALPGVRLPQPHPHHQLVPRLQLARRHQPRQHRRRPLRPDQRRAGPLGRARPPHAVADGASHRARAAPAASEEAGAGRTGLQPVRPAQPKPSEQAPPRGRRRRLRAARVAAPGQDRAVPRHGAHQRRRHRRRRRQQQQLEKKRRSSGPARTPSP